MYFALVLAFLIHHSLVMFGQALTSSGAFSQFLCDIRDKNAVFNILRQNVTNFDVGNGERMRKWREREEMERE